MVYNIKPEHNITINGKPLKFVEDLKYLGSYIAASEHDFKTRKGKAWVAFWNLENNWKSNVPMKD